MRNYWLTFTDGSTGACQGATPLDVIQIAEGLTGKKVALRDGTPIWSRDVDTDPAVRPLPYPTTDMIWQFEHPIHGKTPPFCHSPAKCAGNNSCPGRRSCCV